jgi:prevent-host-death family protein
MSMERTCHAAEARANFSQLLTEAGYAGQETIIERNNRSIAVIVGYDEYLALRQQAGERTARFAVYDEIRARNVEAEPEQVEPDVAEALRAARREQPQPSGASVPPTRRPMP